MTVRDNPGRRRFEMDIDGDVAFASYRRGDGVLMITHVEVPRRFEGQGHATALMRGVADIARAEKVKIQPLCSFARAFMARHADYADLRA